MLETIGIRQGELGKAILKNPLNKRVFSLSDNAYLVGGFIRDFIIGRGRSKDLDFVVSKDIKALTRELSKTLGGTLVELRKEHLLRVCLKDGTTLDFTRLDGDIYNDLSGRDFTINSIAWSPKTGIIDPNSGYNDIKSGVIREIEKDNFRNDPLRLLRAYRFSAELGFEIERGTRQNIKSLCSLLTLPASERITLELFKLLNSDGCIKALKAALSDGILKEIISLSNEELGANIKLISRIDGYLNNLPEKYCFREFSHGLSYLGLLRLEGLLIGSSGKSRLALSRDIFKRTNAVQRLYDSFKAADYARKTFELFSMAGEALMDILILSGNIGHIELARRFGEIAKRGLLRADEIMTSTGLNAGPDLGSLIREVRRLEFEGSLKSKADAIKWLKNRNNP